ncbi:MAG: PPK2 family polyphosphate kinase [Verrucomicrobiota bacterium]
MPPRKRKKTPGANTPTVVVDGSAKLRLNDVDPATKPETTKAKAGEQITELQGRLRELQQALYAEHQRSILIVIQGMDTSGKDGAIKFLCAGVDPNGVQLTNFKYPTAEEFDHDFLWRVHHATPRRGGIGIWNRSHYEDVLVPRVHQQIDAATWRKRCEDIVAFEGLLHRNGTTLLKFFLHISKDEQKARLEARLADPSKIWKFNPEDLKERARWAEYQQTYEDVINRSATDYAPWHVIPADYKWGRNLQVLGVVVQKLAEMNPSYPKPSFDPATIVVE